MKLCLNKIVNELVKLYLLPSLLVISVQCMKFRMSAELCKSNQCTVYCPISWVKLQSI